MKRKMTLSLMLGVSMLLSLTGFAATAQGRTRRMPIADTGVVTLGPNQILRVTADWDGDGAASVQFRQATYMPTGCSGGVCKHIVASPEYFSAVTLMPGEAASIDILSNSFGVRAVVSSDNPNVRVNAVIVDATTGNIIAVLIDGLLATPPHPH